MLNSPTPDDLFSFSQEANSTVNKTLAHILNRSGVDQCDGHSVRRTLKMKTSQMTGGVKVTTDDKSLAFYVSIPDKVFRSVLLRIGLRNNADFQSIFARSASAVTSSEKV